MSHQGKGLADAMRREWREREAQRRRAAFRVVDGYTPTPSLLRRVVGSDGPMGGDAE